MGAVSWPHAALASVPERTPLPLPLAEAQGGTPGAEETQGLA